MFQEGSHYRPLSTLSTLPLLHSYLIQHRYGKILTETCASVMGAKTEIDERVLTGATHACMQLDFFRRIWETLDEEHQNIKTQILQVLVGKLSVATSKLGKSIRKRSDVREARRWKYIRVKQCLDEAIQDLASWQKMFYPSWFLIMKVSDSVIDLELSRDGVAGSLLPSAHGFRDALKKQPL